MPALENDFKHPVIAGKKMRAAVVARKWRDLEFGRSINTVMFFNANIAKQHGVLDPSQTALFLEDFGVVPIDVTGERHHSEV